MSDAVAKPAKKSGNITTWILISLVAGIVLGLIFNKTLAGQEWFDTYFTNGIFYVLGQGFIRLMQMLVVPLVFCSIVCGAASMSDPKMLGKVGGGAIIMYLCTTAVAVILALLLGNITRPGIGLDMASVVQVEPTIKESDAFTTVLLNIIPTNVVNAMANGTMLQIIFFALLLGFILGNLGRKVATVNRFFTQFNAVMMMMVSLILKVAPIGIFCLITKTFTGLGIEGILPMIKFIGTVYLGLAIQLLVTYMVILFLFTRLSPLHFLKKFWPVMVFAFSTSSSNATIPLNMETLNKRIGVNEKVSSFTIPLGATINMDGTAIMQGVAVIFALQAFGLQDIGIGGYLTVILTATLASIGTAGVPGVGTIMTAMVFESVGLPVEGIAMIMGVDRILDMGRTAINVTGDAVVTTCMAKMVGMLDRNVYNNDDIAAVDLATLGAPTDPVDFDDFTEHGDPTEIGELGSPDKFENIKDPRD